MNKVKPSETPICKYLRAKNPYGGLEGGSNSWYLIDTANTICWCIKSSGASGPDNGLVAPQNCVEGRRCFIEPE